jgi:hypothetical protein
LGFGGGESGNHEQANMNRRQARGLAPLAALVPRIAGAAFSRRGFLEARILTDWPQIVGPALAAQATPLKLVFPRGNAEGASLQVRVNGAYALELQHQAPLMIERINRYFGYRALARLVLSQGPPAAPAPPPATPVPTAPPAQAAALDARLEIVENPQLRAALQGLGRGLLARRAAADPAPGGESNGG